MDLNTRYGLGLDPFLKNAREILYEGAEFREALFRLDHLSRTKGSGVLTGSPGRGKTTAVREWVRKLNPPLFQPVYTSLSTLTVNDFYRSLASALSAQPAYRKTEDFHPIQAEIDRLALEKKRTPVIIIDEANYISNGILNDLKILFNFEMDPRDRVVILLVGLPQLNDTLRLSVHEPLRQTILMNHSLDGYSKEEGREYIDKRLKGAGYLQDVFDNSAIEAILNASDGTARIISKLCHTSLVIGNSREQNIITAETAMQAINDCTLS